VPIPFLGEATDPEDGALSGASMVWTDSIEGEIGQGEQFDAALLTLGDHVITLTATDADGNVGEATVSLVIVEP
jgi:chitinase